MEKCICCGEQTEFYCNRCSDPLCEDCAIFSDGIRPIEEHMCPYCYDTRLDCGVHIDEREMKVRNLDASDPLRLCATCKWIFPGNGSCPKCGMSVGSYSAHFVFGDKAQVYRHSQIPWLSKVPLPLKVKYIRMIFENDRKESIKCR